MTKFGTILLNQIRAMKQMVGQSFLPKREIKAKDSNGKRIKKPAYVQGTLGQSAVSERIQKDYNGRILSRRERKELARSEGVRATRYYNN